MSRIIVKNLPLKISEEKLKTVFSGAGEITDISLKYKNGVFRQFGFVGFRGEEEAQKAIKHFNKTFIGTSRIQVDVCHDLNSTEKPRPWSRYSMGSSAYKKQKQQTTIAKIENIEKIEKPMKVTKKVDELLGDLKDSAEFEEFLAVHQNRQTKSLWADDVANKNEVKMDNIKDALDDDSNSDDEYTDLIENNDETSEKPSNKCGNASKEPTPYVLKMKGVPKHCKDRKIIKFFEPLKVCSIRVARNNNKEAYGLAYVSFQTAEMAREALSRNKMMLGDRKVILRIANAETAEWNKKSARYEQISDELVADTGRLYVRNLPYSCTVEALEELFGKQGPVMEVHLPVDKITRKIKGFAFVTFMMPKDALKAYTTLDGHVFQGRILHILPAKEKDEELDAGKDSLKKKRENAKKALAASSHNWNALFLGANAVAESMAEKYSLSKSEILKDGKHSLGVRMALGETQIVVETRQFLLDNGVVLDSFSQADAPRSKTVILAKNLPSGTSEAEIRELFEKNCKVLRVILPPSGMSALVECDDPTEAKTAFRRLAYTKFKHTPLYLEWAPVGVLKERAEEEKDSDVKKVESVESKDGSQQVCEENKTTENESKDEENEEEEQTPEPESCLFVKNLNFDTTENTLKEFFKQCGKILAVSISMKADRKHPGQLLSMGYGFIQFLKRSSAQTALKRLQHKELDGHTLELKISTGHKMAIAGAKRKRAEEKKQTSSKIMIRNIPFEAKQKEVEDLFKIFGEIRMARLPKKMTSHGGHRGFGFVDFVSKQDAKKAFDTLCHSTHLYGRRLVLEWAENEETIEELREKTAKQFFQDEPRKKVRKRALEEDLKLAKGKE